jgi:thiol-disulfide isomerase/thioredoxin
MRRLAAVLLLAIVASTLAACTGKAPPEDRIQVFAPADRKPAPALHGDLLDGSGPFDPTVLRGKVVVVNFWGSWCGPCVGEAPELEAVYAAHKENGVAFLGVDVRDEVDNARAFARQYITYPSISDPSSRVALDFEVVPNAVPNTIILDRQGRIAAVARGPVYQLDLEPVVVDLLAEAG